MESLPGTESSHQGIALPSQLSRVPLCFSERIGSTDNSPRTLVSTVRSACKGTVRHQHHSRPSSRMCVQCQQGSFHPEGAQSHGSWDKPTTWEDGWVSALLAWMEVAWAGKPHIGLSKHEEIPAARGMLCAAFSKLQCCRNHPHCKTWILQDEWKPHGPAVPQGMGHRMGWCCSSPHCSVGFRFSAYFQAAQSPFFPPEQTA